MSATEEYTPRQVELFNTYNAQWITGIVQEAMPNLTIDLQPVDDTRDYPRFMHSVSRIDGKLLSVSAFRALENPVLDEMSCEIDFRQFQSVSRTTVRFPVGIDRQAAVEAIRTAASTLFTMLGKSQEDQDEKEEN